MDDGDALGGRGTRRRPVEGRRTIAAAQRGFRTGSIATARRMASRKPHHQILVMGLVVHKMKVAKARQEPRAVRPVDTRSP